MHFVLGHPELDSGSINSSKIRVSPYIDFYT